MFRKLSVPSMVLSAAACLFTFTHSLTAGERITLGPGDVLDFRFQVRNELSGDYAIGTSGKLFLPGIGALDVAGKTVDEVSDALSTAMAKVFGATSRTFGITVKQFRPIYVGGSVEKPGSFEFFPGLRVAHAISLAGGYRRNLGVEPVLGLELGREYARMREAEEALAGVLIRRDRHAAQLAGMMEFDTPVEAADLIGQARADARVQLERELTRARGLLTETRKQVLAQRTDVAGSEIEALDARIKALRELIALSAQEVATLEEPSERGLIPKARILELRRLVAGTSGEESEALARRSSAESSRLMLQGEEEQLERANRLEDAIGLIAAQTEADLLRERLSASREVLTDLDMLPGRRKRCGLELWRTTMDGLDRFAAEQETEMLPGDLLLVVESHRDGTCPPPRNAGSDDS